MKSVQRIGPLCDIAWCQVRFPSQATYLYITRTQELYVCSLIWSCIGVSDPSLSELGYCVVILICVPCVYLYWNINVKRWLELVLVILYKDQCTLGNPFLHHSSHTHPPPLSLPASRPGFISGDICAFPFALRHFFSQARTLNQTRVYTLKARNQVLFHNPYNALLDLCPPMNTSCN